MTCYKKSLFLFTCISVATINVNAQQSLDDEYVDAAIAIRKIMKYEQFDTLDFEMAEYLLVKAQEINESNPRISYHLGYLYNDWAYVINESRLSELRSGRIDSSQYLSQGIIVDSLMSLYKVQADRHNELIEEE